MRLDHLLSKEESKGCVSGKLSYRKRFKKICLVAMRAGATPVLIPNTTVKTCTADGTILETVLETVWKSRRLPDLFINNTCI